MVYVYRIVSLISGVIGLAVAIGVILIPNVVSRIEKGLDKSFSTEALEKMLNQRKNLTEALLKHPRIFGFILLFISFLLVASSLYLF